MDISSIIPISDDNLLREVGIDPVRFKKVAIRWSRDGAELSVYVRRIHAEIDRLKNLRIETLQKLFDNKVNTVTLLMQGNDDNAAYRATRELCSLAREVEREWKIYEEQFKK